MEIRRTISRIAYRIEEKPEGGFIARCSDSNVPPLEAASRFELEQQIQAKITAEMESQFPGLKIRLDQSEAKSIAIAAKPDGGIFSESNNSSLQPAEGNVKNAVEHWLADKAVSLVEKNLPPELIEQLKHQAVDGKITIAVTKVSGKDKVRRDYVVSNGNDLVSRLVNRRQKTSGALEPSNPVSASFSGTNLDSTSPITPVSGSGPFLRFLLAAIVVVGILFFFLYLKK
jgi:hypothetical protein